jgi:hypothetical protein
MKQPIRAGQFVANTTNATRVIAAAMMSSVMISARVGEPPYFLGASFQIGMPGLSLRQGRAAI